MPLSQLKNAIYTNIQLINAIGSPKTCPTFDFLCHAHHGGGHGGANRHHGDHGGAMSDTCGGTPCHQGRMPCGMREPSRALGTLPQPSE